MRQPDNVQSVCTEGRINLAISAIDRSQIQSIRYAAATYKVPRTTLRDQRAGKVLRRDCEPNSKKLTKAEESVIIQHILELDSRGFPPRLHAVRDMANKLLAELAANQVGIK